MDKTTLNNLLAFLGRVQLTGEEADAFIECKARLLELYNNQENCGKMKVDK